MQWSSPGLQAGFGNLTLLHLGRVLAGEGPGVWRVVRIMLVPFSALRIGKTVDPSANGDFSGVSFQGVI